MCVLVIGVVGFIGLMLVDWLLVDGYLVVGLDNFVIGWVINFEYLVDNFVYVFVEVDIVIVDLYVIFE